MVTLALLVVKSSSILTEVKVRTVVEHSQEKTQVKLIALLHMQRVT